MHSSKLSKEHWVFSILWHFLALATTSSAGHPSFSWDNYMQICAALVRKIVRAWLAHCKPHTSHFRFLFGLKSWRTGVAMGHARWKTFYCSRNHTSKPEELRSANLRAVTDRWWDIANSKTRGWQNVNLRNLRKIAWDFESSAEIRVVHKRLKTWYVFWWKLVKLITSARALVRSDIPLSVCMSGGARKRMSWACALSGTK